MKNRKPFNQRHGYRLRVRLFEAQSGRCYLCPQALALRRCTKDHVVPRTLGGRRARNLLLAHERCNRRKGGRAPHPCELLFAQIIYERLTA